MCSAPIAFIRSISLPISSIVPLMGNLCWLDEEFEEESNTFGYVSTTIRIFDGSLFAFLAFFALQGALPGPEDLVDVGGGHLATTNGEEDRHQAAHHPAEERRAPDRDLDQRPLLANRHRQQVADGAAAGVAAEGGEVALPHHPGRGRPHGGHVQVVGDLERPMPVGWAAVAVLPDPVAIRARHGVSRRKPRRQI